MDLSAKNMEARKETTAMNGPDSQPAIVFQPPRLSKIVEIVDVMGNVVESIREENARDIPTTTTVTTSGGVAAQTGGVSARDAAIAAAPTVPVMQQKLVQHLRQEVRIIQRQASSLSRKDERGSAYLLNVLYRKIRRLSSLINEILHASSEIIRRFYIAVFIDHQALVVRGGSLVPSDE